VHFQFNYYSLSNYQHFKKVSLFGRLGGAFASLVEGWNFFCRRKSVFPLRLFVCSFVRLFVVCSSFVLPLFVCSFVHLLVCSFVSLFFCSFVRLFVLSKRSWCILWKNIYSSTNDNKLGLLWLSRQIALNVTYLSLLSFIYHGMLNVEVVKINEKYSSPI
jgi:hypothetical protein